MSKERVRQRVLSVAQVATMCHVTRETIRRWIRTLGLVAYNTTGGLAIKILESDLRAFAERMNVYVEWDAIDDED
jgi:excisionase family DNA binding protein